MKQQQQVLTKTIVTSIGTIITDEDAHDKRVRAWVATHHVCHITNSYDIDRGYVVSLITYKS